VNRTTNNSSSLDGASFHFPGLPTDIFFGDGIHHKIGEYALSLGARRVLLVSDSGLVSAGIVDQVESLIRLKGCEVIRFTEIPQDSNSRCVEAGAALLNEQRCEVVIGLGGGSPMDAAKAIAVAATNPGPIVGLAGLDKVCTRPVPMIAVPTTAGTGSEVSKWAIMTDDNTHEKVAVGGRNVFPTLAVCDPVLTVDLPPMITATTGMDALTHAIESASNKSYQPISELLALRAITLISRSLLRAVHNGRDIAARRDMMMGSMLAGIAMNPTRLGLAHALAMPLGSWDLQIPHGSAISVLLPISMQFNSQTNPEAYLGVADALGIRSHNLGDSSVAADAAQLVLDLAIDIGAPRTLGELGLQEHMIPHVCEVAMKSGNIPVNPRAVIQTDLEDVCRQALEGKR